MSVKDCLFTAKVIRPGGIGISMNTARSIQGIEKKALSGKAEEVWYKRLRYADQKVVTGMLEVLGNMMSQAEKPFEQSCKTCKESKHTKSLEKRD